MHINNAKRYSGHIDTPIGQLNAVVDARDAVIRLDFSESWKAKRMPEYELATPDQSAMAPLAAQLAAYFAGTRKTFELALAPNGSDFLKSVWEILCTVPYGTTVSYGELARALPKPTSARAMGMANAVNPISIIVPCHRVIGTNGNLTGYGGGLQNKKALLLLEAEHSDLPRLI